MSNFSLIPSGALEVSLSSEVVAFLAMTGRTRFGNERVLGGDVGDIGVLGQCFVVCGEILYGAVMSGMLLKALNEWSLLWTRAISFIGSFALQIRFTHLPP
jgi:hypothetical protein